MRRQNLLYYKNATLLKNALSFFGQSVLHLWETAHSTKSIILKNLAFHNKVLGTQEDVGGFLSSTRNNIWIYVFLAKQKISIDWEPNNSAKKPAHIASIFFFSFLSSSKNTQNVLNTLLEPDASRTLFLKVLMTLLFFEDTLTCCIFKKSGFKKLIIRSYLSCCGGLFASAWLLFKLILTSCEQAGASKTRKSTGCVTTKRHKIIISSPLNFRWGVCLC